MTRVKTFIIFIRTSTYEQFTEKWCTHVVLFLPLILYWHPNINGSRIFHHCACCQAFAMIISESWAKNTCKTRKWMSQSANVLTSNSQTHPMTNGFYKSAMRLFASIKTVTTVCVYSFLRLTRFWPPQHLRCIYEINFARTFCFSWENIYFVQFCDDDADDDDDGDVFFLNWFITKTFIWWNNSTGIECFALKVSNRQISSYFVTRDLSNLKLCETVILNFESYMIAISVWVRNNER